LPAAVAAFDAEHVSGAMALYDTRDGKLACSDPTRCDRGYIPASTFKIANTIIGLETGVVSDADSPLPWDGKQYDNPDWNRDHTLRSAVQVSCVPCFQSIARKVGEAQMKDWVSRLDYGNHDIGGKIDKGDAVARMGFIYREGLFFTVVLIGPTLRDDPLVYLRALKAFEIARNTVDEGKE